MEKFDKPELLLILNTKYSIGSTISIHHPVEKNKRNERQRQVGSKLLLLGHAR